MHWPARGYSALRKASASGECVSGWSWRSSAFLWSLGGYTPFYHLVYALVPGTKYFRAPGAFFFIPAFAIAALAGEGLEALMAGRVSRGYAFAAAGVAAFIAMLAVSGALVTFGSAIALPQLADLVTPNAPHVTFGSIRALIAVVIVAGVILALSRQRVDPVIAAYVVTAVMVIELWSVERLYLEVLATRVQDVRVRRGARRREARAAAGAPPAAPARAQQRGVS